jgi:hypothetical protein
MMDIEKSKLEEIVKFDSEEEKSLLHTAADTAVSTASHSEGMTYCAMANRFSSSSNHSEIPSPLSHQEHESLLREVLDGSVAPSRQRTIYFGCTSCQT